MKMVQENIISAKQDRSLEQHSEYIWFNGALIPWQEAKIHMLTHSLHYSGGVFEGEKAYNGNIFKLAEHTNRLIESANILRIQVPYSFDDIIKAHHLLIEKNNIKDAYVRPLIWYGSESLNITNETLSVNLLIVSIPPTPKPVNSLNLHISRWRKAHPNALPPQCKSSGHYNMMILCKKEAQCLGYDDAILLDWRGYVAECTTSNIFFVKDNQLFTPIVDSILNGITRLTIIELAEKLNINVKEDYITLDQLQTFEQCFVTGTSIEVKEIKSISHNKQKIIFQDNHTITLLQKEYYNLVGR